MCVDSPERSRSALMRPEPVSDAGSRLFTRAGKQPGLSPLIWSLLGPAGGEGDPNSRAEVGRAVCPAATSLAGSPLSLSNSAPSPAFGRRTRFTSNLSPANGWIFLEAGELG